MKTKEALSFDDVSIVDDFSEVTSRSLVEMYQDVSQTTLPIVTASMDTVTNLEVAKKVIEHGGMFLHHRYCSVEERVALLEELWEWCFDWGFDPFRFPHPVWGVAVGLNETEEELVSLLDAHASVLSLDVAAANNSQIIERIRQLVRLKDDHDFRLIVGNFSNASFATLLASEGLLHKIDFLKVSQGGGSACTTRINIGIGVPTFQAVIDLEAKLRQLYPTDEDYDMNAPFIIADGGVKTPGDAVKALGAGASLVMMGSMLAGHEECPGEVFMDPNPPHRRYKHFRGMASADAKEEAGMPVKHVEGVSSAIRYRGPIEPTLMHIRECIQSGIATAGFDDINDFIGNAQFVRLTAAGRAESLPHIYSVDE